MVKEFKIKHENEPYEFIQEWIAIHEQTEKLITGGEALTGLTMKTYWHTMSTLEGEY